MIEIFRPRHGGYNLHRAHQELSAAAMSLHPKARAAHFGLAAYHLAEARDLRSIGCKDH
jgi:hypothetical protein